MDPLGLSLVEDILVTANEVSGPLAFAAALTPGGQHVALGSVLVYATTGILLHEFYSDDPYWEVVLDGLVDIWPTDESPEGLLEGEAVKKLIEERADEEAKGCN